MGVHAWKRRQQRRMDIDQPVMPLPHEPRRQDAHEAGETDQLNARRAQFGIHSALKGFTVRIVAVVQRHSRNACCRGALQPRRV